MNIKDKFKLLQWAEAIIWIIVISLVIFGVRYHNYKAKKELKTYQIFLQDVDGLIVGSPVRMMGVAIGYIEKVKIIGDTVYVKFVLDDKNASIPRGSIATVEFNGLGGSKSLEIYPPTEQSLASNKLIVSKRPMRLNDSIGLIDDMFDKLTSMIIRGSRFATEMSTFMPKKGTMSLKKNEQDIKEINTLIDNLQQNRQEFKTKLKELKNE
ncbi:TPA: MCE family protein [Candidatus Scatousia excrementigallinarum]|uniref:MCE family protein n=1 Tax=Candidatus Scatousia excrementigallinarum TaxID=2840935 RepID=A0A9D1JP30_9BACT|nr:MCE family protein [Candidatus Scatousia excrementigallinarum]